jgi:2,3-bisphosphoglycerate-dependent phosphoglycerate mutase
MYLEIVILRHGQSAGNRDRVFTGHSPSPLTERGHREALAAAQRISARPVDEIHSSDLERALDTAAPLVARTGVALTTSPALRERSFGKLTGRAFNDVEAKEPEVWRAVMTRDPHYRPAGGESNIDCRERVGGFLDALIERRKEGRVVLVSHGVAINQMLYHLLGLPPRETPAVVFHIENCSVQRVERRDDGTLRITCINDKSHLAEI